MKQVKAALGAVAAVAFVGGTIGGFVLWRENQEPVPKAAPIVAEGVALDDVVDNEAPDTPTMPNAGPVVPALDVVRIDANGSTLVAGHGAANADVILRLDGEEIAIARTDADGNFVSLFDLASADIPRILSLETKDAAGTVTRAEDSIIVAPAFPAAPSAPSVPEIASGVAEPSELAAPDIADASAPNILAEAVEPAKDAAIATTGPSDIALDSAAAETTGSVAPTQPTVAAAPTTDAPQVASDSSSAPPRLFRAGPSGVQVLAGDSSAPQAREDLGIDAITYDVEGDVQLAGRGQSDTELRIYVDDRPVQTTRVDAAGNWASPLPNVDQGVYTLRIDAVGTDGTVVRRIETPFQRTAPEVARAARERGVAAITVQPGFTLWAISEGYFGDGVRYVQIFEANRDLIRDPDLIYPGQVIDLPETQP